MAVDTQPPPAPTSTHPSREASGRAGGRERERENLFTLCIYDCRINMTQDFFFFISAPLLEACRLCCCAPSSIFSPHITRLSMKDETHRNC